MHWCQLSTEKNGVLHHPVQEREGGAIPRRLSPTNQVRCLPSPGRRGAVEVLCGRRPGPRERQPLSLSAEQRHPALLAAGREVQRAGHTPDHNYTPRPTRYTPDFSSSMMLGGFTCVLNPAPSSWPPFSCRDVSTQPRPTNGVACRGFGNRIGYILPPLLDRTTGEDRPSIEITAFALWARFRAIKKTRLNALRASHVL